MSTEIEALQTAIGLHQAGQLSQAEQIYRKILESSPWQSDALHLVGVVAHQSGRHELAIQYIGQAIAASPAQPDYYNSLGNALQALGSISTARTCYEKAIQLAPNHALALENLGNVVPGLKPFEAAGHQTREATSQTDRERVRGRLRFVSPLNASHEHRCVFIHIPKNGGTSIKRVLDMPGGGHRSGQYYATRFPQIWERYSSFAVVRNPWDRAVSAYHHARMKESLWHNSQTGLHPDYQFLLDKSFGECVAILYHERARMKHDSWLDQSHFIVDPESSDKNIIVDTVLRFETLAEDFAELCRKLGIHCAGLPTVNSSQRSRNYRSYYDERTRKMIEQVYGTDIDTFGYSF